MADLPDYYTQAQISEAEAASFKGGLEANRPDDPVSRDLYLATDTIKLYYCVVDGVWVDITHACLLLAGGTMTGAIAMGTNKITGLGDPTANQDAATRAYVLAQKALCLLLAGGTMSGNIAMGGNKITGLGAPAAQDDALRYGRAEIRTNEIAAAAGILLTQLEDAVCSETEADNKIAAQNHPTIVRKTADQTVNNSTVLENDDHLLLAVAANEVWEFTIMVLIIQVDATAIFKFGWAVPVGTTMRWKLTDAIVPAAADDTDETGIKEPSTGANFTNIQYFSGVIIVGGNAGNVNLQWAQKNARAANNTVLENSCLIAHQLL